MLINLCLLTKSIYYSFVNPLKCYINGAHTTEAPSFTHLATAVLVRVGDVGGGAVGEAVAGQLVVDAEERGAPLVRVAVPPGGRSHSRTVSTSHICETDITTSGIHGHKCSRSYEKTGHQSGSCRGLKESQELALPASLGTR